MILTLTMNPCTDITVSIPSFVYGGLNRVETRRVDMVGKGINVSRVLKNLDQETRGIGMSYAESEGDFQLALGKYQVPYTPIVAAGRIRENLKILDLEESVTTEVNEWGTSIEETDLHAMEALITETLDDTAVTTFVMSGSLPPGTPTDFYRKVIEKGKKKGVRMMLDAEGDYLLEGIKAHPDLIKPNLFEFVTAFAPEDESIPALVERAREIIEGGVGKICISLGADGALLIDKDDAVKALPLSLPVQSTQGAGDSLMAGLCIAIEKELPLDEQLRYGVACAQGSVTLPGTELCTQELFDEIYPQVKLEGM